MPDNNHGAAFPHKPILCRFFTVAIRRCQCPNTCPFPYLRHFCVVFTNAIRFTISFPSVFPFVASNVSFLYNITHTTYVIHAAGAHSILSRGFIIINIVNIVSMLFKVISKKVHSFVYRLTLVVVVVVVVILFVCFVLSAYFWLCCVVCVVWSAHGRQVDSFSVENINCLYIYRHTPPSQCKQHALHYAR